MSLLAPVSELTGDSRLQRVVDRHPHPLLFVTISGAHLYGFPSPDSDCDLRGVHLFGVLRDGGGRLRTNCRRDRRDAKLRPCKRTC